MRTAVTMHHQLLRRHVRICGGYEVKTEGDSFMVAFTTVSAALLWCSSVQTLLLDEPWPKEILDLPEGREVRDAERDPHRSRVEPPDGHPLRHAGVRDGLGLTAHGLLWPDGKPSISRANSAAGGQILLSADALRELEVEKDSAEPQLITTVDALLSLELKYINVGERKLKGLEIPEVMTAAYPLKLLGRLHMPPAAVAAQPAPLAPTEVAAEHPNAEAVGKAQRCGRLSAAGRRSRCASSRSWRCACRRSPADGCSAHYRCARNRTCRWSRLRTWTAGGSCTVTLARSSPPCRSARPRRRCWACSTFCWCNSSLRSSRSRRA
jgi:class 3 adenylate cyclase